MIIVRILFLISVLGGGFIDPLGGRSADGGPIMDPNGGSNLAGCRGDYSGCVDPNG